MYIPKQYGKSKVETCPFCEEDAFTLNSQRISVCDDHKNALLGDMKCVCGQYVELKQGRYGTYFNCLNCGNINSRKVFEINEVEDKQKI